MSSPADFATAALQDLLDDTRNKANKHFYASRFVSYGDCRQAEAKIRLCLDILNSLPREDSLPVEVTEHPELAG